MMKKAGDKMNQEGLTGCRTTFGKCTMHYRLLPGLWALKYWDFGTGKRKKSSGHEEILV